MLMLLGTVTVCLVTVLALELSGVTSAGWSVMSALVGQPFR
jgi:hypothetical protein